MDQASDLPPVIVAAGVIARSPQGRVLMVRRVDDGTWSFPGGKLKIGETAEQAAFREFDEECGYKLGGLKFLMRRKKDDGDGLVDFSTFFAEVPDEFAPRLNHEASAFGWFSPDEMLAENRADSAARADSVPVVGAQGNGELERALDEGLIQDELERTANPDRLGGDGLDDVDPDPDDLDDELADLILSQLEALDARLRKIEDQAAQEALSHRKPNR